MADPDDLVLELGGRTLVGWREFELSRSIETASATFRVSTSVRGPLTVHQGEEFTARVAGELLMRGHLEDIDLEGDESSRTLTLAGRDLTADLVDCSATTEPGEWEEIPFAELIAELCEPFGIEVRFRGEPQVEPFTLFRYQPGETAWNAIERACRLRGYLAFASGDGALVVSRPGRRLAAAELAEGRNVKRYKLAQSGRQRFQTYIVRGQNSGADAYFAEQAAEIEGRASDPGVARFRPLLVLAEGPVTFEDAQDRARWEASVRAARAAQATVEVQGWRQRAGYPTWNPNELTRLLISSVGFDRVLLISGVKLVLDAQGRRSELTLTRPDAYAPQPEIDTAEDLDFAGDGEDG